MVDLMEMAFYGGVSFLYRILRDLNESGVPNEADLQMLRDIRAEVDHFNRTVRARASQSI